MISNSGQKTSDRFYSLWKFSRPHTIIGTTLSVLGLYILGLALVPTFTEFFHPISWLATTIACLCGNVYIVGLNQIEDIAIDKINKPHLPLASGEFSVRTGWMIVGVTGILALVIAWLQGVFLLGVVSSSLLIGTAYSLPPIRLKRFPLYAALCIFVVRGIIVNLGIFQHFRWIFSHQLVVDIPPEVWMLTGFMILFGLVIALLKDIPDMAGDKQYHIRTFTIQLGAPFVLNLALSVLAIGYLSIALASWFWLPHINPIFASFTHLSVLGIMYWRSMSVDLSHPASVAKFYQFIWKLFFIEYLLFPLACLLKY
ncbi:homogentisate phytyltransferase [Merismopedia glauca]|uniref:Homogentisate phytyltransferase n=1 Tax=Merismopedia glauca CCAP 1448/3 TaxID=1296344 RepID=A0A2T1C6K0_9CYAN|nr:homogentisate phytyltransferase [Merismopedia glauca]PSB03788.1 homogentisate phytyltransferase [Merismopedia glauca CCAP 1448/3]